MLFTVVERLLLLNALSVVGDFSTLKSVRGLREEFDFSDKEHALLRFSHQGDGSIQWTENGARTVGPKEVIVGPKANQIIVDSLKALDQRKRLSLDHLALFERFVGENGSEQDKPGR
jgi:hypothetical protein